MVTSVKSWPGPEEREQAGHIPGVAATADLPAWNGGNARWWEYARAAAP